MATNTANYNLVKPADNETADISVINSNMDKIDTAMKENADVMLKKDGTVQMTGVLKTVGGGTNTVPLLQMQLGDNAIYNTDEDNNVSLAINAYFDGTNWRYKNDGKASLLAVYAKDNVPWYYYADTGTKDSVLAWTGASKVLTDKTGLPLTGGTLSGDCHVTKNAPTLRLINSTGHVGYLQCQEDNVTTLGTDNSSGTDAVLVWLTPWAEQAKKIMLGIQTNGTWVGHLLYGTHNITVSTTAPSSALAEGCQHQVYA